MRNLLKIGAIWLLAAPALAQSPATDAGPDTEAVAGAEAVKLPEERRWRFGVALGYGERSNPLIQSDDIPIVIDLDIAWFGDRWFFDNGDLGLSLTDNRWFTTNLVARVNSDRTFFGKTNTRLVNFRMLAGGETGGLVNASTGEPIQEDVQLPLDPPKRDYAIEAGFETLFDGDWGQATLRAFHDVSGTHDGYEISADYSYRITRGRLSVAPSVGLTWKSAALSDYYWGVHRDEVSSTLAYYEARGGLGWESGIRASYYLTKSARLAVSANYESLQHSVARSPLIERDYVIGYFAGIGWQF